MSASKHESAIQSGYDRWAEIYDHDGNPLQALEEPFVRQAVGDVHGLAVLDLGCGTGRHTTWLAQCGAEVTAVDFSEGMLAQARSKIGVDAVRFVIHDLHTPLPFAAEVFDLVVSGLVLEHLRELPAFFAEVHRVLKPGGRAVFSAMHPAMFLKDAMAQFHDPLTGEKVRPGSFPHTISDFIMAALDARFRLPHVAEYSADNALATHSPRAAKYVGWPMLFMLQLKK